MKKKDSRNQTNPKSRKYCPAIPARKCLFISTLCSALSHISNSHSLLLKPLQLSIRNLKITKPNSKFCTKHKSYYFKSPSLVTMSGGDGWKTDFLRIHCEDWELWHWQRLCNRGVGQYVLGVLGVPEQRSWKPHTDQSHSWWTCRWEGWGRERGSPSALACRAGI